MLDTAIIFAMDRTCSVLGCGHQKKMSPPAHWRLKPRVKDHVEQIRYLAETCLQIPNIGDLPGISRLATRTSNELASALSEIRGAAMFFNYADLARIVEWANQLGFHDLRFSVDGAALRVENDHDQSSVRIARPAALAPVETGALSNLLASLVAVPNK